MAIYFIQQQGGEHMIKIGYSKNIGGRLKNLSTASSYPLLVVGTLPNGTERQEIKLHKRFEHYRKNGEWFEAKPAIVQYIHNNCDDAFQNLYYYSERPDTPEQTSFLFGLHGDNWRNNLVLFFCGLGLVTVSLFLILFNMNTSGLHNISMITVGAFAVYIFMKADLLWGAIRD